MVPSSSTIENTLMDIALAEGTSSEVVSQKTPAPLLRGWAGPEILLVKFIRPVLYNILILSTPLLRTIFTKKCFIVLPSA